MVTPEKVNEFKYMTELKNFRFVSVKPVFGEMERKIDENKNLNMNALTSVMRNFKEDKTNTFFLVLSGNKGLMLFTWKGQGKKATPYLVISARNINLSKNFEREDIKY